VGSYVLDCDLVWEKVDLEAEGTYTQNVIIKESLGGATANGKWSYDANDHCLTLDEHFMRTLNRPDEVDPDYAHPKGRTIMQPEYWFRRLGFRAIDDWPGYWKVD